MSHGFVFDRLVLLIIFYAASNYVDAFGWGDWGTTRALRGDGENPYIKAGGVSGRDSGFM